MKLFAVFVIVFLRETFQNAGDNFDILCICPISDFQKILFLMNLKRNIKKRKKKVWNYIFIIFFYIFSLIQNFRSKIKMFLISL